MSFKDYYSDSPATTQQSSYMPVCVAPLTYARHPAPPDSHTALFTVVFLPCRPLQIGMSVHLHLLASPVPLGSHASATVLQAATTVPIAISGRIDGQRACEAADEDELVLKNDDRGAHVRRAFLRVHALPGKSVDLDVGQELSQRLHKPPMPSPLPPSPPMQTETQRSHTVRPPLTHNPVGTAPPPLKPSSSRVPAKRKAAGSVEAPTSRPKLRRLLPRIKSRSPSPPWRIKPRTGAQAATDGDRQVSQSSSVPDERGRPDPLVDVGPEDGYGAPAVGTSCEQEPQEPVCQYYSKYGARAKVDPCAEKGGCQYYSRYGKRGT